MKSPSIITDATLEAVKMFGKFLIFLFMNSILQSCHWQFIWKISRVYINDQSATKIAQRAPKHTRFTSHYCKNDSFSQTIFYHETPTHYHWNKSQAKWCRRKIGKKEEEFSGVRAHQTLGRVDGVYLSAEERFFSRMLLCEIKGSRSFEKLLTVDGFICASQREACCRRGMLDGDKYCRETLE